MDRDPVYKGATRPASFLGIPVFAFGGTVGAGVLCASLAGSGPGFLISLGMIFPVLLVMRLATAQDDQVFRLLAVRFRMRMRNLDRTRRFWGASAYSPIATGRQRR